MTLHYLSLLLALAFGHVVQSGVDPQAPCDQLATDGGVSLTTVRIGPYPTGVSLDSLRRLCPNAQPTVGYGYETEWAALDLSIGDLTILAGQNWQMGPIVDAPGMPRPEVEWSRSPSHWMVQGCGAALPHGVSSCGTWADLSSAYGVRGTANADFGPVVVTLQTLPGFSFTFDVTDETVGPIEVHQDLARIPGSARIVDIVIVGPAGAPE